jgi:hypothetical protein
MKKLNRRRFLTIAGAGSVAAVTGAGASVTGLAGPGVAAAYSFRGVAALPTDHRLPEWGSYVVEGHVNPSTQSGSISKVVYAGRPEAMSRIALVSHVVRVESVKKDGALLHIKGVVDDRSHLLRGESDRVHLIIDTGRRTMSAEFFGSRVTLELH